MHFGLKFLIRTAFTSVMFIRGEALISMWMSNGAFNGVFIRGLRLYKVWRLLEQIRQL